MAGKDKLRQRWAAMAALDALTPQQRGFELERLLLDLARLEQIPFRPSYRVGGEQIDAVLEVAGRFLFVETRWAAEPVSLSEVYAFSGKVEGKLLGALGLFISISGFAEAVERQLGYGKPINVILADGDDLAAALDDAHGLSKMIRSKLRRAAQYGEVLYNSWVRLDIEPDST